MHHLAHFRHSSNAGQNVCTRTKSNVSGKTQPWRVDGRASGSLSFSSRQCPVLACLLRRPLNQLIRLKHLRSAKGPANPPLSTNNAWWLVHETLKASLEHSCPAARNPKARALERRWQRARHAPPIQIAEELKVTATTVGPVSWGCRYEQRSTELALPVSDGLWRGRHAATFQSSLWRVALDWEGSETRVKRAGCGGGHRWLSTRNPLDATVWWVPLNMNSWHALLVVFGQFSWCPLFRYHREMAAV